MEKYKSQQQEKLTKLAGDPNGIIKSSSETLNELVIALILTLNTYPNHNALDEVFTFQTLALASSAPLKY